MSIKDFFLAALLALSALPAMAFDRSFPPGALRGKMAPAIYPAILVDGKSRTLSAGARIWNRDNLIEQPASLRESGVPVNYTVNDQGEIDRVWMLRPEEAAVALPKPVIK